MDAKSWKDDSTVSRMDAASSTAESTVSQMGAAKPEIRRLDPTTNAQRSNWIERTAECARKVWDAVGN
jgi:hypothetical protein